MSTPRYVERRSIPIEDVLATAASTDSLALAARDRVLLLQPGGETVVEVDDAPTALALGDVLVVASTSQTTAYDRDGAVLWRADVGPFTALTYARDAGLLVGSGGDELIGLDADDGEVRFRTPRPNADIATDHHLTSWGDEAVLAAWFSLWSIDADGDRRLDTQVDGAISHLGVVDDVAVVALQNDDVVGIDLEGGGSTWTSTLDIEWLADHGRERLLARIDGELHAITETGDVERIGDVGAGDPVVAASGSPLCLTTDDAVTVFEIPSDDLTIDATLLSEVVRHGAKLEFRLSNVAETAVNVTLHLEAERTSLDIDAISAEIPANGETTVSFPVSDPEGQEVSLELVCRDLQLVDRSDEADGEGSVLVSGETVELLTATLPVVQESSLVTDLAAESVRDGDIRLRLTVGNRGEEPVRQVVVSPGDETIRAIPPGESVTRSLTVPIDGAVSVRARGEDPLTDSLDFPDSPVSLSVTARDPGFVDVAVENVAGVTVYDDVDIEVSGTPALPTRSLHLEPEETVTFVIPAPRGGSRTVEVETSVAALSETVSVSPTPASDARQGDRADGPGIPSDSAADPTATAVSEDDGGADRAEDAHSTENHQFEFPSESSPVDAGSTQPNGSRESDPAPGAEPRREPDAAPPDDSGSTSASEEEPSQSPEQTDSTGETATDESETDPVPDEPPRRESPAEDRRRPRDESRTTPVDDGDAGRPEPDGSSGTDADAGSASTNDRSPAAAPENADQSASGLANGPEVRASHADDVAADSEAGSADGEPRAQSVGEGVEGDSDRLSVDRAVDETEAFEGYAVVERLRIANGAETPTDVTLNYDDCEQRIEDVPARGAITATRLHVAYGVDEMTLAPVVALAGQSTERTEAVTVPVSRRAITPWVTLSERDETTAVAVHLRNDSNDPCRVRRLRSRGFDRTVQFEDFVVSAGDRDLAEATTPGTPAANVLETAIEIEHRSERSQHQTVGAVRDTPKQTGLAVRIDAVETISEHELNVSLLIENTGVDGVDVEIEAEGEVPDDYLYSAAQVSNLESGETFTHRIECTLERDRAEIPVSIVATVGSETVRESVTVAGPVDGTSEQWDIDRPTASVEEPEPGRISTAYRPRNF
jgi:hypothetical protein